MEIRKQEVENSQTFRALLRNLSKAFDCLSDMLLITKLNTYAFRLKA